MKHLKLFEAFTNHIPTQPKWILDSLEIIQDRLSNISDVYNVDIYLNEEDYDFRAIEIRIKNKNPKKFNESDSDDIRSMIKHLESIDVGIYVIKLGIKSISNYGYYIQSKRFYSNEIEEFIEMIKVQDIFNVELFFSTNL